MSRKERGLFRIIFKNFINSITPKFRKTICVGKDYFGNKYFEVSDPKSIRKKFSRYFVPVNNEKFDQDIPAEWESWLRYRRNNPPTEAEVNQGQEMILIKRKNAAELKILCSKEKTDSEDQNKISSINHASQNFPIYEEYKNHGQNYKKKE